MSYVTIPGIPNFYNWCWYFKHCECIVFVCPVDIYSNRSCRNSQHTRYRCRSTLVYKNYVELVNYLVVAFSWLSADDSYSTKYWVRRICAVGVKVISIQFPQHSICWIPRVNKVMSACAVFNPIVYCGIIEFECERKMTTWSQLSVIYFQGDNLQTSDCIFYFFDIIRSQRQCVSCTGRGESYLEVIGQWVQSTHGSWIWYCYPYADRQNLQWGIIRIKVCLWVVNR